MGRPKMDSGINAIEEEPEKFDSTSNTGALACMINSEVGAVLAIMRRNVRWGGRFMAGSTVNPVLYLQPFLDVVRSDETGAPITGVILSLVYKILTLNVIDLNTVNVEETMYLVVDIVTSCRFEVTDPASEELVLMKILQVRDYSFGSTQLDNGNSFVEYNGQRPSVGIASTAFMGNMMNGTIGVSPNDLQLMTKPYGVPCMVEIFHFLCSLLSIVEHIGIGPRSNTLTFDEDVPLFTSLYEHGASYQQQEVAMEALVDFCRQKTFMVEMYANLDCDITCNNVFEDLSNLLSKSAFPVNCPLSTMHILALDGLITVIQGMAERIGNGSAVSEQVLFNFEEYIPFWTVKCEDYANPFHWVPFVRRRKYIKRRLMIDTDHFNWDPKKGLEFLQGTHLLPDKLDPQSVACYFRYTAGLDKNLVGDFLGNHDDFCVQVLHEFAWTFDFEEMNLDTTLRLFLETFQLPGVTENTKGARGFL
ncbi:hypothetical protein GIB67_027703 [Kingdonia uniflora]|uniref:SEC7 domain-containing protein n=1 Tax=Kingdonia uniflora TaxID=39325 RepID=A0A7J7NL49_9MAGN|nr:hypothetical protein GIB67_027703 [Kingdonia uniflora]